MAQTRTQLREKREEAYRVAAVLREENLSMFRRLQAARELARAQLLQAKHGTRCPCRLCNSARVTLGLGAVEGQRSMWE